MHLLLLLFTSLLAKPAEKSGLYTKDDFVELLDYSNFQYALSDENKFWVVEFYASWCGHCQHFAPYVKSWAAQMQNWGRLVNFGVIDCGRAENSQICSENAITGTKLRLWKVLNTHFRLPDRQVLSPWKTRFRGQEHPCP